MSSNHENNTDVTQESGQVVMDAGQLAHIMNALLDRIQAAPVAPMPGAAMDMVREQRVNWGQLPKLDLSNGAELDSWFLSFEARMTAARILEENWPLRFLECPMVEEDIKVRVRLLLPGTYQEVRRTLLKEHGPIDPVNYFRLELYRVRGSHREEVREALMKILTKLNRAADDDRREKLLPQDLCYPFMNAFPSSVKAALERQFALAFAQVDPFEHLFRLAPSKQSVSADLHVLGVEEEASSSRSVVESCTYEDEADPGCDGCCCYLQQRQPQSPNPGQRRPAKRRFATGTSSLNTKTPRVEQGPCQRCGFTSHPDRGCPAIGKTCSVCGFQGHFARACRKRQQTQVASSKSQGPFPKRPARQ